MNKIGKNRRYCFVMELKKEHTEEYCNWHRNIAPELLNVIKNAGAKEEIIWNYKNLSIVYFECNDIDKLYQKIIDSKISEKPWGIQGDWIIKNPFKGGPGNLKNCDKIFDFNQQLNGKWENY